MIDSTQPKAHEANPKIQPHRDKDGRAKQIICRALREETRLEENANGMGLK
jgi:hypothetical protein